MKRFLSSVVMALVTLSALGSVEGQDYGAPSILPVRDARNAWNGYPTTGGSAILSDDTSDGATQEGDQDTPPASPSDKAIPIELPFTKGSPTKICDTCGVNLAHCACAPSWMGCWFGGAGGMFMTRDNADTVWLTSRANNFADPLLSSRSAQMEWGGGFETRFGRYFNCGANAVEVVYWGLFPSDEASQVADPLNLTSPIDFGSLSTFDGTGVSAVNDWFTNASVQRVVRSYEFHNVEVNMLGGHCRTGVGNFSNCCGDTCGPRGLSLTWAAGVRYFQFSENFEFGSSETNATFGNDLDDLFYNIKSDNHLVGMQIGGRSTYCLNPCWSLYADAKAGVYGNHIRMNQRVGTRAAAAAVDDTSNPYNGRLFDLAASKNDVSMLGEIDLGVRYRFGCLTAFVGWRTVGATGVAHTVEQIPFNFGDIGGATNINSAGSIVLTGGHGGLEYRY